MQVLGLPSTYIPFFWTRTSFSNSW